MTEEEKVEFIRNLRSGEFKQTHKALRRQKATGGPEKNSYCALGVLCETVAARTKSSYEQIQVRSAREGRDAVLGLTLNQRMSIIHLNDLEQKSFAEIADWVEKNIGTEERPNEKSETDSQEPVVTSPKRMDVTKAKRRKRSK